MLLYHGSSVRIERPLVEMNAGFSDLGQGFYCTDDFEVAMSRARARARREHAVEGMGEPAVVRAWIANEIVEMACTGVVPADELVEFIDPAELVVQYCFRSQTFLDAYLIRKP